MVKMLFLFITVIGLMICSTVQSQTKPEKIESLISAYYNADCFNGVVLVSEKGNIIFKRAYGIADRELNVPMTTEMKFRIASISKPFTALIILQLVTEGTISLEGKITDYIPEYRGKKGDSITIYQLLTHTSGIMQNLDPEKEIIQERLYHSLKELIKYAEENDLYFEPGTGFHYSNFAYNILAYIAERVTNKSFDRLLSERIFEPLEMNSTKQYDAALIENNLAKGYEYKLLSGYENASWYDASHTVGCGGLISTAGDLYKFDQALYANRIISKEMYNKMITPSKLGPFGCGWEIHEKTPGYHKTVSNISHSGSVNGFGSYLARIESDSILVIVLKNNRTDTYISPAYAPEIGQEIISILYGEEIPVPKKSIARQVGLTIGKHGINRAVEEYYCLKKTNFELYNFEEAELNKLGIELYFRFNMPEEALRIFEVNMHEFPLSYNTYDSYAFILKQKGDYLNSIKYYSLGLEMLKKHPEKNNSESVLNDAGNALKSIKDMESKLASQKK